MRKPQLDNESRKGGKLRWARKDAVVAGGSHDIWWWWLLVYKEVVPHIMIDMEGKIRSGVLKSRPN